MEQTYESTNYGGDAADNYQKFFVPSIGEPIAEDLLTTAKLRPGERVLDVACGTGVVARLAAKAAGRVTGLDLNPGMLAVARSTTSDSLQIEWLEADAESIPLDDGTYDVALCQMGLQFVTNKLAALREMRRVLVRGGRLHFNLPGPAPRIFAIMRDGISRHLGQDGAIFVDLVFSMHDTAELRDLMETSGFRDVIIDVAPKRLVAPPPREFLWQYIHSTPLAQAAMGAGEQTRDALEADVCPRWSEFVVGRNIGFEVDITTVTGFR